MYSLRTDVQQSTKDNYKRCVTAASTGVSFCIWGGGLGVDLVKLAFLCKLFDGQIREIFPLEKCYTYFITFHYKALALIQATVIFNVIPNGTGPLSPDFCCHDAW